MPLENLRKFAENAPIEKRPPLGQALAWQG